MKKFVALVCAAVLLSVLCSCSTASEIKSENGSDTSQETLTYEERVEKMVGKSGDLGTELDDIYEAIVSNIAVANDEYVGKSFKFTAKVVEVTNTGATLELCILPFAYLENLPSHSGIRIIKAKANMDTLRKLANGGVYQFVGEITEVQDNTYTCILMDNLLVADDTVEIEVYCDHNSPWAKYTFNYTAHYKFIYDGQLDGDYVGLWVKMKVKINYSERKEYELNWRTTTCTCYHISEVVSIEKAE